MENPFRGKLDAATPYIVASLAVIGVGSLVAFMDATRPTAEQMQERKLVAEHESEARLVLEDPVKQSVSFLDGYVCIRRAPTEDLPYRRVSCFKPAEK